MSHQPRPQQQILIVAPDFYPAIGGYAHAISNFVLALKDSDGLAVTVLTQVPLNDHTELQQPYLSIQRIPRYTGRMFNKSLINQIKLGLILRTYIRQDRFEFVLFETLEKPLAVWIATAGLAHSRLKKIAVRIHATAETELLLYSKRIQQRMYRFLVRKLARHLPNIASTTRYYIDFMKHFYLQDDIYATFKNFAVLPNVVVPSTVQTDSSHEEPPLTFLTLGRMDWNGYNQKNFELIAQAVFLLKAKQTDLFERLNIAVVGDGEWHNAFGTLIKRLEISRAFILHRVLEPEQVRKLQQQAQAVILASRYEGQSMFALESLAAGTALIVSRNTGVSDLVIPGQNGCLINPDDPYTLARAMAKLADPETARSFGNRSEQLFARRYSTQRTIEKFRDYIQMCSTSAKVSMR